MNFLPRLECFEGPLDLLLHLIEKNKIDIYDIPISDITDQYMEFLSAAEDSDTDNLSEFLVMAATLLEIKAKMLLPADEKDENEEDPRDVLVKQLLEYKLFKYMSEKLKDRELSAQGSFYKAPSLPKEIKEFSAPVDYDELLADITPDKLSSVYKEVMARYEDTVSEEAKRYGKIKKEEITLPGKMAELVQIMRQRQRISFRELIEKQPTKDNIIMTFLAVLELMKTGQIAAVQKGEDIELKQGQGV